MSMYQLASMSCVKANMNVIHSANAKLIHPVTIMTPGQGGVGVPTSHSAVCL
jgi:hypothetical protein